LQKASLIELLPKNYLTGLIIFFSSSLKTPFTMDQKHKKGGREVQEQQSGIK
jgi:hypothetical protein